MNPLHNQSNMNLAQTDGVQSAEVFPGQQHVFNIEGFIQTLTEAPSLKPRKFSDQIVMVTAGGSTSAYLYDTRGTTWRRVTLT